MAMYITKYDINLLFDIQDEKILLERKIEAVVGENSCTEVHNCLTKALETSYVLIT